MEINLALAIKICDAAMQKEYQLQLELCKLRGDPALGCSGSVMRSSIHQCLVELQATYQRILCLQAKILAWDVEKEKQEILEIAKELNIQVGL